MMGTELHRSLLRWHAIPSHSPTLLTWCSSSSSTSRQSSTSRLSTERFRMRRSVGGAGQSKEVQRQHPSELPPSNRCSSGLTTPPGRSWRLSPARKTRTSTRWSSGSPSLMSPVDKLRQAWGRYHCQRRLQLRAAQVRKNPGAGFIQLKKFIHA